MAKMTCTHKEYQVLKAKDGKRTQESWVKCDACGHRFKIVVTLCQHCGGTGRLGHRTPCAVCFGDGVAYEQKVEL